MPHAETTLSDTPDGDLCASIERRRPSAASTLAGQIVAAVRADLFAGKLKPGDFLGSEQSYASHNSALSVLLRAFRHVVWPAAGSYPRRDVADRVLRTHRAIFEAIAAADGPAARAAMCGHLDRIHDRKASPGARVVARTTQE